MHLAGGGREAKVTLPVLTTAGAVAAAAVPEGPGQPDPGWQAEAAARLLLQGRFAAGEASCCSGQPLWPSLPAAQQRRVVCCSGLLQQLSLLFRACHATCQFAPSLHASLILQ
jgi:hypothetical protein